MKMLLPVLLMLATGKTILPGEVKVKTLPPESREVLDYLPRNIVIAHRGTTYWAPEETEAAMRWARNIGADYLELDLQRTKDGVLIALHDVNLRRTTNVETVFPDRADSPVSEFTLEELRQLDAGSWFNKANRSGQKSIRRLRHTDLGRCRAYSRGLSHSQRPGRKKSVRYRRAGEKAHPLRKRS